MKRVNPATGFTQIILVPTPTTKSVRRVPNKVHVPSTRFGEDVDWITTDLIWVRIAAMLPRLTRY